MDRSRLRARSRELFGTEAIFPVFNGTGANVVGLRAMLRPWEGVICADTAHLNVDECGAPEVMGGIKLLTVPTPDGKLTPALVDSRIVRVGDEHVVQAGVVSVTQSTELGTLYSLEELRGAARSRARAGTALPHRRLAAGERRVCAGLLAGRRGVAGADVDLAWAGPRWGCWRPRRSSS